MATFIIVGNLGRDPEMRYLPSGTAVTNISVADNRQWTDKDGNKQKETTWFRVSFFGKLGEVINQYFKKGDPIYIEGRPNPDDNGNPRMWQRDDGSMAASYDVVAQNFKFISGGSGGNGHSGPSLTEPIGEEEKIPF